MTITPNHASAAVPPRGGGAFLCLLKLLTPLLSLTLHASADTPWSFDPSLLPSPIRFLLFFSSAFPAFFSC